MHNTVTPGALASGARVLLDGASTGGRFTVVDVVVRAGDEPPLHMHTHEDEVIYVLAGGLRICRGDEQYIAMAGDSLYLPRGVEHSYAVIGADARLLVIAAPSGLEGLLKEWRCGPESGAMAVEWLVTAAARYGVEITGPPLR